MGFIYVHAVAGLESREGLFVCAQRRFKPGKHANVWFGRVRNKRKSTVLFASWVGYVEGESEPGVLPGDVLDRLFWHEAKLPDAGCSFGLGCKREARHFFL